MTPQPAGRKRGWSRLIYGPGTRIRIVRDNRDEPGILLTFYDAHPNWWGQKIDMLWKSPRLMLCASQKKLYGYECWWIPVEELPLPAAGGGA
jgi:hypothetical protein